MAEFLDTTLRSWLDDLSAGRGGMAGGAASALAIAMAARLTGMAARRAEGWPEAAGFAAQAEALGDRAVALLDEDARAFVAARAALDGRAELPDESRDVTLSDALQKAAEVPARMADLAADVSVLAEAVAVRGQVDARPDAAVAAQLAAGAARGACHLVAINLGTAADDPLAASAGSAAERADQNARDALSGAD